MMNISTEEEYKAAMAEIDALWKAEVGTPEFDRFEEVAEALVAYENQHFPIVGVDEVPYDQTGD